MEILHWRTMDKKEGQSSIKEVMQEFVQSRKIEKGYRKVSIVKFWKEQMGDMINGYTKDLHVSNQVLYVTITSSPLKQELDMNKPKVLKMINEHIGVDYIKSIVFR